MEMIVECSTCNKVYNFKAEKLPSYAFSFRCKKCSHSITVSKEQIDHAKTAAKGDKKANKNSSKKKAKTSLPKIQPEKLKKSFVKFGSYLSDLTGRSERYWIFTLTKFVAYFSIGLTVVLVILGGLTYFSIASNNTVTYAEVGRSLELKQDPLLTIQAAVPEIKVPKLVDKYLGGDNRGTFVDWMKGLSENQKKDFINNLELIIEKVRQDDPENIYEYINEYASLKFKRSVDKPAAKYLLKFGLIIAMIIMIGLLGLFSLILLQVIPQKTTS